MISLSLRSALLAITAAALFSGACGAQEGSRPGRGTAPPGVAPMAGPPPAFGSGQSAARPKPAAGPQLVQSASGAPLPGDKATASIVGQTARKVDTPARFVGGLQAQNAARADAGLKPLIWSAAREDEAQAAVNSISSLTCSRSLAERMGAAKDVSSYWAPSMRLLDGTGAGQDLSSSFVVSEWLQERPHYNVVAGCDRKGACENYSRMVRPAARTVGCAIAICSDQSQVWACRYGD